MTGEAERQRASLTPVTDDELPTRPLSLVVVGNSLTFVQVPPRPRPEDGTYGEVARDRLWAAGVPATLHLEGRWFDFAHRARRRYEETVRPYAPDVVSIQYGLNEAQPWIVPVWVLDHVLQRNTSTSRTAQRYRDHVVPPVWRVIRWLRRHAAPRVSTWQLAPHRFAAGLINLVYAIRIERRALVLLHDVGPPGELLEHFLPGIAPRLERMNEVVAAVVHAFDDPDVRLVHSSTVVDELGPAEALRDGQHWSPAAHARVGRMLADEVLAWRAAPPADVVVQRPDNPIR